MANEMTCDNFVMTEDGERFEMAQIAKGDPGFSPIANVTQEGDITTITITDLQGTTTAEIDNRSKASWIYDTAAGDIVSFPDGADNAPMKALVATIEPVQEGEGEPSPVNIRPITGYTGLNGKRAGKNVVKITNTNIRSGNSFEQNGIEFTPELDENGSVLSITANGSATARTTIVLTGNISDQVASGQYILSGCPSGGGNPGYRLTIWDNTASVTLANDYGNSALFDVNNTHSINYALDISNGVTVSNLVFRPMIRPSSYSDGAFEPHVSKDIAVDWQSAAGVVYSCEIDVITGKMTVDRARALNVWTKHNSYSHVFYRIGTGNKQFSPAVKSDGLCNMLPTVQANSLSALDAIDYGLRITDAIYVVNKDVQTAEEFNVWATQNDLQVVYTLATPNEYQLTPQEVTTLLGKNTVWTDVGPVSVTAPRDTKMYIDRKIAENVAAALNP